MVQLNFTSANENPKDHIGDMTLIWVHPKYFYFNEAKGPNYNLWKYFKRSFASPTNWKNIIFKIQREKLFSEKKKIPANTRKLVLCEEFRFL